YNAARRGVNGMQIAGLVNRAGKVNGVQLAGLVNIADSSDYPLGLINLIRNGQRSIAVEGDTQGRLSVGFRSGSRVMYGIVGMGYGVVPQEFRYLFGAGIGANLVTDRFFGLAVELSSKSVTDIRNSQSQADISILPQLTLIDGVNMVAGLVVELITADTQPDTGKPI